MLQVSYLNLYKSFEMMCLGDISLKRKVLFILLDGLENTFSVIFFDKIEECPLTVFLT